MIAKIVKWILWVFVVIGVILGAFAVYSVLQTKKEFSEFKTGNTVVDTRLTKIEILAGKMSQDHVKLAEATAGTLKTYGEGIGQNRQDVAETSENVAKIQENVDGLAARVTNLEKMAVENRQLASDADKKASDALVSVESLGKEMRNAQKKRVPKPSGKSTQTTPPVVQQPPAIQQIAPVIVANNPPTDVSVTVISSVRAVQNNRVQRENLLPEVMSRRYSYSDVKAGRVVVTKRYGNVTVHNHIPGSWHRQDQILPVQIPLSSGITTYSDADWVSFSSDAAMEIELRK